MGVIPIRQARNRDHPGRDLMPNVRSIAVAGIAAVLMAAALPAQSSVARCAPLDTTAKWYAMQRLWADDSKHTWSND